MSRDDLSLILKSRVPIVVIESHEEKQVLNMIRNLSRKLKKPMFVWTVTEGLKPYDNTYMMQEVEKDTLKPEKAVLKILKVRTPGIYVLCDFHPYLENAPEIIRLIKQIALGADYLGHTIILLSASIELPEDIKHYSAKFHMPMPDAKELEKIIREEANRWSRAHNNIKVVTHKSVLDRLIRSLMGLTITDARRLARKAIYDDGAITGSDLPQVNKAKFELLGMDGILSFEYETSSFKDVGGLSNLKKWLDQRKPVFYGEKKAKGLDPPKGIMLLGVQGGGKSLAAKAVAGVWEVPLLRLDFAALYNKYFGETEKNLRKSLKTAEVMAPAVLWVDEIEKGVAAGDYDSGTSKRVLGTLLTWMAERKAPVFIVATANNISALPPELIRKGRLDEIFFVDLPDFESRKEIFAIHLKKRNHDPAIFDIEALAKFTDGYSGAEIEQVVVAGLYRAVAKDENLSTNHLLAEIKNTKPLSIVMADKIARLRAWAKERTVPAN